MYLGVSGSPPALWVAGSKIAGLLTAAVEQKKVAGWAHSLLGVGKQVIVGCIGFRGYGCGCSVWAIQWVDRLVRCGE